jgi:hypothetical protein
MSAVIKEVFSKEIEELEAEISEKVSTYSLADAIRGGASVTDKATGSWGGAGEACAMTAAAIHIMAMQGK